MKSGRKGAAAPGTEPEGDGTLVAARNRGSRPHSLFRGTSLIRHHPFPWYPPPSLRSLSAPGVPRPPRLPRRSLTGGWCPGPRRGGAGAGGSGGSGGGSDRLVGHPRRPPAAPGSPEPRGGGRRAAPALAPPVVSPVPASLQLSSAPLGPAGSREPERSAAAPVPGSAARPRPDPGLSPLRRRRRSR